MRPQSGQGVAAPRGLSCGWERFVRITARTTATTAPIAAVQTTARITHEKWIKASFLW